MSKLENEYQKHVVSILSEMFPDCMIVKNDPQYQQGIPDLLILWHDKWAMLEVKASVKSQTQPNQPYFVELFNNMSFAAFIYPENEIEVLNALQQAFAFGR